MQWLRLLIAIFCSQCMKVLPFHLYMSRTGQSVEALKEDLIWKSVQVQHANRSFQILQGKNLDKFIDDSINVNEAYDPFGVVTWPSSEVAASILSMTHTKSTSNCFQDRIVLDLGCGTGLSTLMALSLGASVIAMDNNPITLGLIEAAVDKNFGKQGRNRLETREFNVFSDNILPPCDYMILSDMLYSTALATRCAERAYEAISNDARVLITDPERSTCKYFVDKLNELKGSARLSSYDIRGTSTEIEDKISFTRFNTSQFGINGASRRQAGIKVNFLWLSKASKALD
jgi:predicted nicotinamide N-methyase